MRCVQRLRLTHQCDIVETGNENYRVTEATANTKKRIAAREAGRKGTKAKDAVVGG